ncbi:MAG: hypothetical protein P8X57_14440 [Cyclobacteriaceae bacterium]
MRKIHKYWPYGRALLLIIVGVFNTALIRPEDTGTWKNYLGYALLVVGILDVILQVVMYFKRRNQVMRNDSSGNIN